MNGVFLQIIDIPFLNIFQLDSVSPLTEIVKSLSEIVG